MSAPRARLDVAGWLVLVARSWELHLLVLAAALFMLPGAPIDSDVLKGAFCAVFIVPLVLVSIAWREGTAAGAFLGTAGLRLYVGSILLAVLGGWMAGGFDATLPSSVPDRIIIVALSLTAALVGAVAARRHPDALWSAAGLAGAISGVYALRQALGFEQAFSPPPELTNGIKEVVALMGNSTRAGALLALALPALAAVTLTRLDKTRPRHADTRSLAWPVCALVLVATALLLTQARGARLAALAGVVVVMAARGFTGRRSLVVGGALALSLLATSALGGLDVLLARKLPDSAPILSGQDVTTSVRLEVWRSTTTMVADGPGLGHGLGLYRESFAPYRSAAESELPGLHGAATEVWHPHSEWLLSAAEGGWAALALLALFAGATLVRARRNYRQDHVGGDLVALGVMTAGLVVASVQDAWSSPGTAVIVFAAAGHVWSPLLTHSDADKRRGLALGLALAISLALAFLAWPRWAGHHGAWSFQSQAAAAGGIRFEDFDTLASAAAAAPHDIDLQRMTRHIGLRLLSAVPPEHRAEVSAVLADVVLRIEALQARAAH